MDSAKGERLGERIFVVGTLVCVVLGILALVLPALSFARARAQRVQCIERLKEVQIAALIWAQDGSNFMPRTFLEFSDRLASLNALICPAAPHARKEMQRLTTWKDFDERSSSYEILNPGIASSNGNRIFLRCKVHDMFGYVDGAVYSRFDATNGMFGLRYEVPSNPARTSHSR